MNFKTKFIAEIGSNHNRSLSRCYKLINEAKNWFLCMEFQLFRIENYFLKMLRSSTRI